MTLARIVVIDHAGRADATRRSVATAADGDVSVDAIALAGDGLTLGEADLELVRRAATVVLGPGLPAPERVAAQVFRVAPLVQMLFLFGAASDDGARLRRELGRAPATIGTHWVVLADGGDRLQPILRDAVRATLERRQPRGQSAEADDLRRLIIADHYLSTVLHHSNDAIVSLDVTGRVLTWNAAATRIFGWTEEEIRGKSLAVMTIGDAGALALMSLLRQAAGGAKEVRCEVPLERKDGAVADIEMTLAQVRDDAGRPFAISAIARDLVERRRADERRGELAARERASEQLRRHNEELQAADRQKDAFLAVLAHELRNPLAPVATALDILKSPAATTEAREASIAMMERQVAMLSRLVDDLMDVSRLSTGTIVLRAEEVDLVAIVARSVDSVRVLAERQGHTLTVRAPERGLAARADPVRIEQVLINLLTNAIKYTAPGGRIELTAAEDHGKTAVIAVRDTGIGIAADMLQHVFEPFAQARPGAGREQGGLGIGLTLARTLVELHGGTVSAESAGRGLGAVMTVRLPLLAAEAEVPAPSPTPVAARTARGGGRILVVDDNVDAGDSLEMLLSMQGYTVTVARDGTDALEQARAFRPDVVLLDIGLPDMTGYDVARALREEHDAGRPTPLVLIAITGWGTAEDRLRAQAAGIDHHLVKPIHPPALLSLIDSVVPAVSRRA
ncbi:MAG TPA: ATP-binding protein [Kofleriaceae bacterium]|nr:ATP-binding protein [Kofleriaceae bacterium]